MNKQKFLYKQFKSLDKCIKNIAVLRCGAIHDGMPEEEIDEYIAQRAREMFRTYGEMSELELHAFYLSEIVRAKVESPEIYQSALEHLKNMECDE